MVTLSAAVEGV